MIQNYNDFRTALLKAGFSTAVGSHGDIFTLVPYSWNQEPPDAPIRWHTGDPDTDPWEWRLRVLDEESGIAYAKVFSSKGGYITREWYPSFLAVRRGGISFADAYADGTISHFAKRIYEAVSAHHSLPLDEIKRLAGFSREDKSKFDRALTELQMKLYLTVCGTWQKTSQTGEPYGWASTVFCTTELFWGKDLFDQAEKLCPEEAVQKITEQVLTLNPLAQEKKVLTFIKGI